MLRLPILAVLSLLFVVVVPSPAGAQWFGAAYLGGNATHPADITVTQPVRDTALTIREVQFDARPLESPQYYGLRIGRLLGASRRYGLEVEFIHLKVIARTEERYRMTGAWNGAAIDETRRMDDLVQRYSMSHGLNYLLVNAVARRVLGDGRAALIGRLGAGPTYPHAESTIDGATREQYEFAGLGGHLSAGVDVRLRGRLSVMAEYKLTASRPEISVADGTGRVRAVSHHVAAGLAYGLTR
jgi:hypothetical protein